MNNNTKRAIATALLINMLGMSGCATRSNTNDLPLPTPSPIVSIDGDVDNVDRTSVTPTPVPTAEPTVAPTVEPTSSYDYENNEFVIYDDQEVFTTEKFEDLVANYVNMYGSVYENKVNTTDVAKFAAVANIDLLSEDNPELINIIGNGATKVEFLNDAAKMVGATVMYNFSQWDSRKSTKGFVRVSDIIFGEQKEKMLKIEEYVDRIADAANQEDEALVNSIINEFLIDMNSGSLSKLDDGVGFVAQVDIALIADVIGRNYLNKENFDMLQILKTSEKYVSNIFSEYEKCVGEDKTYTRK